jgi:tetratricopeptide (TPR) repeat protein
MLSKNQKYIRIGIMAFFLSAGFILSAQDNVDALLKDVDKAIADKDYQQALQNIDEVLSVSPNNLFALEKKVNVLYKMDDSKSASNMIDLLLQDEPHNPEFIYLRAVLNMLKEKYSKSLEDFNAAFQYDMPEPYLEKLYLNRGIAYLKLSYYDEAEKDISKAIEINPKNATAYQSRGMLKYELKEYDSALEDFKKSLQLDDNNPIASYNLGMTYYRLDEPDNACFYFNKSCSGGVRNACRMLMMECAENIDLAK